MTVLTPAALVLVLPLLLRSAATPAAARHARVVLLLLPMLLQVLKVLLAVLLLLLPMLVSGLVGGRRGSVKAVSMTVMTEQVRLLTLLSPAAHTGASAAARAPSLLPLLLNSMGMLLLHAFSPSLVLLLHPVLLFTMLQSLGHVVVL